MRGNPFLSLSHIQQVIPLLPGIAEKLGIDKSRLDDTMFKANGEPCKIDVHMGEINDGGSFVVTFSFGKVEAIERHVWSYDERGGDIQVSPVPLSILMEKA